MPIELDQLYLTKSDGRHYLVKSMYRHKVRGKVVTIVCQDCISKNPVEIDLERFEKKIDKGIFTLQC